MERLQDFIKLELFAIGEWLKQLFELIFPEYPYVGVLLAVLAAALFIGYLFRSGFMAALKVSLTAFIGISIVLFVLHHLNKVFHVL